jgi:hypothetical protein
LLVVKLVGLDVGRGQFLANIIFQPAVTVFTPCDKEVGDTVFQLVARCPTDPVVSLCYVLDIVTATVSMTLPVRYCMEEGTQINHSDSTVTSE